MSALRCQAPEELRVGGLFFGTFPKVARPGDDGSVDPQIFVPPPNWMDLSNYVYIYIYYTYQDSSCLMDDFWITS